MIELYHNDMSVCAQKVRLVLAHKNVPWQSKHLNLRAGEQFNPAFLCINPKGVIPVLVHNNSVIIESNVICYYLEEVFVQAPLMPESPVKRAQVRVWLTQLDAGLHEQIAVISFCLAFRQQILKRHSTDNALENFFAKIPDPSREAVMRDMVINGTLSPRFKLALLEYKKLLKNLATALKKSNWIVGNELSLADFAYLPYIERLAQLKLEFLWAEYPQVEQWLSRLCELEAYKIGMQQWHNSDYIKLMTESSNSVVEKNIAELSK